MWVPEEYLCALAGASLPLSTAPPSYRSWVAREHPSTLSFMSSESSSSSALALADGRRGAALRFDSLPDELLSIVLRHCCERVATVGALDQALQQRQRALLRRSVLATVRGRYGIGWDEATARPTALLLLLI